MFVLFLVIKVQHRQIKRKSLSRLWNIRFQSASWLLTYWFWIQQLQSISIFKSQRKQNKQFCVCSKLLLHTSSSYHDIAENDHLLHHHNDFSIRQLPRDISGLPDTDQVKFSPDYFTVYDLPKIMHIHTYILIHVHFMI